MRGLLVDDCSDSRAARQSDNSLTVLGWLAILLGGLVIAVGMGVYDESPWFGSISASATFYGTAYLLPFVLGGMAVYFWGYRGYAPIDRMAAKLMASAAAVTAFFQCETAYNRAFERVGALGLSPAVSDKVHTAAAIVLFATLVLWIGFLFTRTARTPEGRSAATAAKRRRNIVYAVATVCMTVGLLFFVLDRTRLTGDDFPLVWLEEVLILVPAGLAILVKAGSIRWLNDKE